MTASFRKLKDSISTRKLVSAGLAIAFAIAMPGNPIEPFVSEASAASTGKSGLPLPRFVSLKSKRVNMRVGPGREFQVLWRYLKPGLPMEIIQEYDNWRKVRDPEGNEGWILHSLLSSKRTAVINPWESDKITGLASMHQEGSQNTRTIAKLEPWVVAKVEACDDDWCKVNVKNIEGYVSKTKIWGVYPDEKIEE
ncbi:MAG: SH3 domain-containing protein [Rhizobiaceae bacterium]|nr:SH3 domain-containing protein [Rhizobiaceae bacterium]